MNAIADALLGQSDLAAGVLVLQQRAALAAGRPAYTLLDGSKQVAVWRCVTVGAHPSFSLEEADSAGRQLLLMTAAPQTQSPGRSGPAFAVTRSDGAAVGHVSRQPGMGGPAVVMTPPEGSPLTLKFSGSGSALDNGAAIVTSKPVKSGRGRNPVDLLEIRIGDPLRPPLAALLVAAAFASRVWNNKATLAPGAKAPSKGLWGAALEVFGNIPS